MRAAVFSPDGTRLAAGTSDFKNSAAYVWEVAKTKEQPSATYVARMVEIESTVSLDEAAAVQTREFDYTKVGSS